MKSTKSVQDKRLRVDMSHLKHLVNEQKELQLNWIASSKQLADCLTKTTSANYGNLDRIIGVGQAPSFVTPESFDYLGSCSLMVLAIHMTNFINRLHQNS